MEPERQLAEDLSSKYLDPKKEQNREERKTEARNNGFVALLIGCALIALGIWLTRAQHGSMVYYGAVLVGVSSSLQGLYCLTTGRRYTDLPRLVHVVTFLVGFAVAIVFAVGWTR